MTDPTIPLQPVPDVPVDPREMLMRQTVARLCHFSGLVGQMQMAPTRDAKMNVILGNQSLIMQALMMVLDDMVMQVSGSPEIRFGQKPSNGDGPTLVGPA